MNGILLKLGQKEGFLAGKLFPFCRIAFGVAGGAFFNDALKILLQTGDHAPRRFFLLFSGLFLRGGFGRPSTGVKASPEAHLHAADRGDDADVVPAFAVDAQSLFFQGAQNVRPIPDKSPRHFFLEEGMNDLLCPVTVAFPDFLTPSFHAGLEQIGLFRKLVPRPCRVIGPRPAFAPVEEVAEDVKVLVPPGGQALKSLPLESSRRGMRKCNS